MNTFDDEVIIVWRDATIHRYVIPLMRLANLVFNWFRLIDERNLTLWRGTTKTRADSFAAAFTVFLFLREQRWTRSGPSKFWLSHIQLVGSFEGSMWMWLTSDQHIWMGETVVSHPFLDDLSNIMPFLETAYSIVFCITAFQRDEIMVTHIRRLQRLLINSMVPEGQMHFIG